MRIVINGSFVTDVLEPNDVDCALLVGPGFPLDAAAETELRSGLPYIGMDLVEREDFDFLVERLFATDRLQVPKGMIEIMSWTSETTKN